MNKPNLHATGTSGVYYGLFRATVLERVDPQGMQRIKVNCPMVYGDIPLKELPWAVPRFPSWEDTSGQFGGAGQGGVPIIGAPVYIEFEGGDPLHPVWSGGWYPDGLEGSYRVPDHAIDSKGRPDNYFFTTPRGTTFQLDDREGDEKILVRLPEGDYFVITKQGLMEACPRYHVNVKTTKLIEIQCDTRVEIKAKTIGLYATEKIDLACLGVIDIQGIGGVHIDGVQVPINSGATNPILCNQDDGKIINTSPTQDGIHTVKK